MSKDTVVIGFLGSQLDGGQGAGRWDKWRPSVSLVQHEDLLVKRIELLHGPQHLALAQQVSRDIAATSPGTEVRLVSLSVANPWDFGEMYAALFDWVRQYPFDTEREQYWTHITTGTHVAQICMFLMVESRFIPGVLLQTAPPRKQRGGDPGSYTLIDLDLSRYDGLAQRFNRAHDEALDFLKSGVATRNQRFNALIEEIERVAVRSQAPILLTGPTGAGKSHLARRMFELKRSRHQVRGEFVEVNCATLRGDSAASTLFGHKKGAFTGAVTDRAGLLRTAHQGVLFLDELPEFQRSVLEVLREPLESGRIVVSRAARQAEFPARFQLVGALNPCPCGYLGHYSGRCRCTPDQVARYRSRISGPLLDRIDLHIEVPAVPFRDLSASRPGTSSAQMSGLFDGGNVHEYIAPAIVGLDEAVAFIRVEKLDRSGLRH